MSVLRTIEQKIEGLFEGVFGRAFRTHVQPVELARKLTKEMDDHRMASVSRTYAPNEFTLFLSTGDRSQFKDYESSLVLELQDFLAEHARREGYVLLSPPTVTIDTDADLPLGHFGIATRMVQASRTERPRRGSEPVLPPPIPELDSEPDLFPNGELPRVPDAPPLNFGRASAAGAGAAGASAAAAGAAAAGAVSAADVAEFAATDLPSDPEASAEAGEAASEPLPEPPPAPARPPSIETMVYTPPADDEPPAVAPPGTVATLVSEGVTTTLTKPVSVLGRSRECEVVVADLNVSRRHAEIHLEAGTYWLVDLESTNGTMVNGKRVKRVKLESGDRIEVGSTELVFERSER
jgi:hypothetical protein